MIAVILVAALVAAVVSVSFITFFWFKVMRDIDTINLNFREGNETHEKNKDKQKQWEIEQVLFDKIRKERKIKSEQETTQIDVQEISSTQKRN